MNEEIREIRNYIQNIQNQAELRKKMPYLFSACRLYQAGHKTQDSFSKPIITRISAGSNEPTSRNHM